MFKFILYKYCKVLYIEIIKSNLFRKLIEFVRCGLIKFIKLYSKIFCFFC